LSLSQNELALLVGAVADIRVRAVEITVRKKRGWLLQVEFKEAMRKRPRLATLRTARGHERMFKDLETVVGYLKTHCPRVSELLVQLERKR
jgi:hypothetical protein